MKKPCIIIDVDGTLANVDHRRENLLNNNNWKEFNGKMNLDSLNYWCYELIELFREKYCIVLITGRREEFSVVTKKWLKENNIFYTDIYFRKKDDFRPDELVKREIYEQAILPIYDTFFVVDDRNKVVEMWRALGLVCLQCADGNF